MTKNNNGPSSSGEQPKNEDEELLSKIRNRKSPNDLPEDLTKEVERISLQIWERGGFRLPLAEIFENLHQKCKESLECTALAEWCMQYEIPWALYAELRGNLLAEYDSKRKGKE